ncbi:MAG TPA: hypothetical protein VIA18_21195 [Polyangia bacterium]|jgi:hypothetical protein|nr:hypothetical protein [Polyangia bacterium]
MLASFVAALACVIATPQSRADVAATSTASVSGALLVDDGAMSLPVDVGPLSSPASDVSDALAAQDLDTAAKTVELMSPLDIDCERPAATTTPAPPATDWSALASRFDVGGSCCIIMHGHTRTAQLRAARGHSGRRVAAGVVSAAPELLVPDAHAAPLLWPSRFAFAPTFAFALLAAPAPPMPPAAPASRIDRPPRA